MKAKYNFLDDFKINKISGIYRITNLINNKMYIGSSLNMKVRFRNHKYKLIKNTHENNRLQNAFNKYGIINFEIEIISICPPEYCIKLEQWFVDNLKPFYNIRKLAISNLGFKFTKSSKRKISKSKQGVKNPLAKLTKEQVKEIRKSNEKGVTLAKLYNISTSQISFVRNYKSYKNVKKLSK